MQCLICHIDLTSRPEHNLIQVIKILVISFACVCGSVYQRLWVSEYSVVDSAMGQGPWGPGPPFSACKLLAIVHGLTSAKLVPRTSGPGYLHQRCCTAFKFS